MSSEATVRPGRADDADAMMALMPRLADFDIPPARTPEHLWTQDAAVLKAWLDGEREDCLVHVAETRDAGVVGVAMTTLRPELLSHEPSAHLEAIAVAPGMEGQGIGKLLLQAAERAARDRGAQSITLHVFSVNERARGFYEKMGYDGELMRYIKQPLT